VRLARVFHPALMVLLLLPLACGPKKATERGVGLVFDVGGRGDKSFNDSAYRGLQRAQAELGVDISNLVEPSDGSDRESALRNLAAKKLDLIFGIGFIFTDDVNKIAMDFPRQKFACVDYALKDGEVVPENVQAIRFREEEGSFLVGALAAMLSKTHRVGFVGGMDIALIHKFAAGYQAGARYADSSVTVVLKYAGVTGDAFKNPTKGKELALGMYAEGVDIIYHASGSTGLGVFEAAKEQKKLAIGVDSDQWQPEFDGVVLTSMIKNVDQSVFRSIQSATEGTWKGGVVEMGLREGGVGYIYDEHNRNLIPPEVKARLDDIQQRIISGRILVPRM
jgi:basic membrane protein A and related proteins